MNIMLADRVISVEYRDKRFADFFARWETEKTDSELTVITDEEKIAAERVFNIKDDFYPESSAILRSIAEWLPLNNSFLLHSAVFDVNGSGVALAAHSGTGKTTHMLLWQKLLGDKLKIINGDKPIIRFFENEPETPYAYGTPWNGKEHFGNAERTPLRHLCFVERADVNSCERVTAEEITNRVLSQVYMPHSAQAAANTLTLINRLVSSVKLWKIKCNTDISAAQTAYNAIFKGEEKNEA